MTFDAIRFRGVPGRRLRSSGRHRHGGVNCARALVLGLALLGGCKDEDDSSKPPSQAMCIAPGELPVADICDPKTAGCYVLTDEWRSQGGPDAYPPEATDCGGIRDPPNQCCPGVTECAGEGTRCLAVVNYNSGANGGLTQTQNRCARVCQDSSECAHREICWGGTCEPAGCSTDSDCDRDPCGRCVQRTIQRPTNIRIPGTLCVYEGRCGADTCANCFEKTYATRAAGSEATFRAHECLAPVDNASQDDADAGL